MVSASDSPFGQNWVTSSVPCTRRSPFACGMVDSFPDAMLSGPDCAPGVYTVLPGVNVKRHSVSNIRTNGPKLLQTSSVKHEGAHFSAVVVKSRITLYADDSVYARGRPIELVARRTL